MLASHPGYAFAQDRSASPELEALIPDEAIDNAQEWAADGVPPAEELSEFAQQVKATLERGASVGDE